jgi:hypothetical protein
MRGAGARLVARASFAARVGPAIRHLEPGRAGPSTRGGRLAAARPRRGFAFPSGEGRRSRAAPVPAWPGHRFRQPPGGCPARTCLRPLACGRRVLFSPRPPFLSLTPDLDSCRSVPGGPRPLRSQGSSEGSPVAFARRVRAHGLAAAGEGRRSGGAAVLSARGSAPSPGGGMPL